MPEPAMIDPLAAPAVSVPDAPLPTSALAGRLAARKVLPAGREAVGVQLSERPIGALWQVTAWAPRLAATGAAVAAACGAPAPGPGMAAGAGDVTALRIEPLRWLLLVEPGAEAGGAVVPALGPGDGTVLDLGHARTRLVVGGTERVALMARLGSIDWRPPAFGPGSVTTTQIGRVAVTVLARQESFELLLPRSYATSLFDIVAETAEGFGLEIAG
ncbi:MAG: hypothetical protein AAF844_03575 [Pseudomonadota bacterium]